METFTHTTNTRASKITLGNADALLILEYAKNLKK